MIAAVVLMLTACPHRFDPAAAPSITSPDPQVNQAFKQALALFAADRLEPAALAFAALEQSRPSDPLVHVARLYRGRIALRQRHLEQARQILTPLARRPTDDSVGTQARYHLGLTLVQLGQRSGDGIVGLFREARQLLAPFLEQNRMAPADLPGLLAALSVAARELSDPVHAGDLLARLHELTERPVEKLYARQGLRALIDSGQMDRTRLGAIYRGNAGTPSAAVVGLLVPLHGRYRTVGRELLQGAIQASGALGTRTGGCTIALAVRDSSNSPDVAARQLIDDEQVVALVGTLNPTAAAAVAGVAASMGVPFIAVTRLTGAPQAMQLMLDSRLRAAALARHGATLGLRRIVTLAPDTSYSRAMVQVFAQSGVAVAGRLTYPAGTTSFSSVAEQLVRLKPDGLFVPDTAHNLSLLAPALARAGLWSAAARERSTRTPGRRPGGQTRSTGTVQLLCTADGLSPRLVAAAGRYVQGAVLAPGFAPDDSAPHSGMLVRRYIQDQSAPPTLVAALGFDAVELVCAVRQRGAHGRAEISTALRSGPPVPGLTGNIQFDAAGHRVDPPLLYQVEPGGVRLITTAGAPAGRTPPSDRAAP